MAAELVRDPPAQQSRRHASLDMLSAVASVLPAVGVNPARNHIAHLRGPILRPRHIFCIIAADKELASIMMPSQWRVLAQLTHDVEHARISKGVYADRMKRLLGREILRVLEPYRRDSSA
jgi:hypothetical protein